METLAAQLSSTFQATKPELNLKAIPNSKAVERKPSSLLKEAIQKSKWIGANTKVGFLCVFFRRIASPYLCHSAYLCSACFPVAVTLCSCQLQTDLRVASCVSDLRLCQLNVWGLVPRQDSSRHGGQTKSHLTKTALPAPFFMPNGHALASVKSWDWTMSQIIWACRRGLQWLLPVGSLSPVASASMSDLRLAHAPRASPTPCLL